MPEGIHAAIAGLVGLSVDLDYVPNGGWNGVQVLAYDADSRMLQVRDPKPESGRSGRVWVNLDHVRRLHVRD